MSNLAKLSKQALQHEHDRQFDKALALYAKLFDEAAAGGDEVDVALLNRAGDVAMRVGDAPRAVGYFERAIDAYAAGGLLNNAIAVCNKLLRQAPEHAATHYTLAVLHAKQGFRGDAKHHFVEYAERMHRAGRDDEALKALTEFAALCPAGDDARSALAKHLAKGNRGTEIGAKLEAMLPESPRADAGASAPVPSRVPTPTSAKPAVTLDDDRGSHLVFLDVSLDSLVPAQPAAAPEPIAPLAGLELTSAASEPVELEMPTFDAGALDLEPTSFDLPVGTLATEESWGADALPLLDEPVEHEPAETVGAPVELLELDAVDMPAFELDATDFGAGQLDTLVVEPVPATPVDLPMVDLGDDELVPSDLSFDLDVDDLDVPDGTPVVPAEEPYWEDELPGELPALSLSGWIGSAAVAIADAPVFEPVVEPVVEPTLEPSIEPAVATPAVRADESAFVDLGDWLRADEPAPTTRLTTEDVVPTGDEAADFERMLGVFKAGIARNVDSTDHASHYDLGVAFREMGLLDEAIGEFQRAARDPRGALRAREALGGCVLDRGSPDLAAGVLEKALDDATATDARVDELSLLGVVYLLGEAYARLGQHKPARACFQRVVTADIEFRDAARRLTQLPAPTP
jgi:tetratricopeptide (TPR) repeat protein